LTARPVASAGSPFAPSMPFCRLASALIRLASTAKENLDDLVGHEPKDAVA
jgi:hypothetical protein